MKVSKIKARNMIYKLKKYIYGLKETSRQWYLKFHEILITFGFKGI